MGDPVVVTAIFCAVLVGSVLSLLGANVSHRRVLALGLVQNARQGAVGREDGAASSAGGAIRKEMSVYFVQYFIVFSIK